MMIVPSIATVSNVCRIASIAALSTATSSPRPIRRDDPSAAASVTRTRSMPRLRSIGGSVAGDALEQRVGLGDEDALLPGVALREAALQTARLARIALGADAERHRLGAVEPRLARRAVIRRHQDAPVTTHAA